MFHLNRFKADPKKPVDKVENSQELAHTDAQTMAALEEVLQETMEVVGRPEDHISTQDIRRAAFHIALRAEQAGQPLTYEKVTHADEDQKMQFVESMGLRLKARPMGDPEHS